MQKGSYAANVVTWHVDLLGGRDRIADAVCLELGPGDSLASALIAHALGAASIYLVDTGDFADRNLSTYRAMVDELRARGLAVTDLDDVSTVDEMLGRINARYLTDGLRSLQEIGDSTVDLIWSNAVLEHIRRHEVIAVFRNFRRILKPQGAMSHRIDFMDHLGGSLNNLRFSSRLWESEFMAKSGFYTNRLRHSEMLEAMLGAGFEIVSCRVDQWAELPLPRRKMATEFRGFSDADLRTSVATIVARPRPPS
jgi:SAM-dependent methyltransferase